MRRRSFLTLLGGAAAAWPLAAGAQQAGMRRIGVLTGFAEGNPAGQSAVAAFRQRMGALGWVEGRNVHIDVRWATDADPVLMQTHAADLVRLKTDTILVNGPRALSAAQRETRDIPIIFAAVTDPVRLGYVESLAKPGGNVTGFSGFPGTLSAKLLEALKEFAPHLARVALISSPDNLGLDAEARELEKAALSFAVMSVVVRGRTAAEIERGIQAVAREVNSGLIILGDVAIGSHRDLIVRLAREHHLPAAYPTREYVEAGGLMSYGSDTVDRYIRAAAYVDRILKGAKPTDLPVQQPTRFHFVLNLKTARAFGPDVPTATLLRADEVIE